MDIVRLSEINHKLDPIVQFDDDDDKTHRRAGLAVAGVGTAGAGYFANQAIRRRQGAMNAVVPGAKTSYASAAQNLYQSGAQRAKIGIESAAKSSGQWMEKLLSKLRGVKLASKTERLVQLNQALTGLIELESPLASFDKSHRAIMQGYQDTFNRAKAKKKEAKRELSNASFGLSPEHPAIQRKLHRESYLRRGVGIGALVGATAGGIAGGKVGKRFGLEGRVAGGIYGTLTGAAIGAGGGMQVGGRIRRAKPLPPGKYGIENYPAKT